MKSFVKMYIVNSAENKLLLPLKIKCDDDKSYNIASTMMNAVEMKMDAHRRRFRHDDDFAYHFSINSRWLKAI